MMRTSRTKRGESEKGGREAVWATAIFLICTLVAACGPNEGVLKSGKGNVVSTNSLATLTSLESDVEAMRTANFTSIYVLRRKDRSELDSEDRGIIKLNTDGVNRRISSDNGKAFVIGSNSPIPADKLAALYDRFAVENYSPPESTTVNGNVNAK